MSFFKGMTFARAMILLCVIGSCVASYFVYENFKLIQERKASLEVPGGEIETLVEKIQIKSKEFTQLAAILKDENLEGQADTSAYIRTIARMPRVDLGRISISTTNRSLVSKTEDKIYTIEPFDKSESFSRTHIANFLWNLEDMSRKVRVTELRIEALPSTGKRLKPHEYPSDQWSFSCKLTSRKRK